MEKVRVVRLESLSDMMSAMFGKTGELFLKVANLLTDNGLNFEIVGSMAKAIPQGDKDVDLLVAGESGLMFYEEVLAGIPLDLEHCRIEHSEDDTRWLRVVQKYDWGNDHSDYKPIHIHFVEHQNGIW